MGLDMYLSAKLYTSEYSHAEALEVLEKAELPGITRPPQYIKNFRSAELKLPVAYWRKANQIHAWFVENVQGGVDQCQLSYVSTENIQELRDLCREVLAARGTDRGEEVAKAKLPVQEGFFFGGTQYDDWYYEQLEETAEAFDSLLTDAAAGKLNGWQLYYQSSW